MFTAGMVVAAVLIAVNYSGENGVSGLEAISMSNIPQESSLLWVHFVATYVMSGLFYYLVRKTFKEVTSAV